MTESGLSELDPTKVSNVKWHDSHIDMEDVDPPVPHQDDDGFLARQKRRISEHPQISKIQLARKTSKHNISFLRTALIIMASSTIFKIAFFLMRLIPISKILMSLIFFDECPVQVIIVYYLLVGGILAVLRDVIGAVVKNCLNEDCLSENEMVLTLIAFVYTVGEFFWFIFGSYYVFKHFGEYPWKEQNTGEDYCNNILYIYSFVVTTISYALLIIVFTISCCTVCLAKVTDTSPPSGSSKT